MSLYHLCSVKKHQPNLFYYYYLREAENLANCKTESYSAALILLAWPPAVMIRMCDRGRDNLITGLGTRSSCVLLLPQCTCKGKENTGGGLFQPHSTQALWEGPAGHSGCQKCGCNSRVREEMGARAWALICQRK